MNKTLINGKRAGTVAAPPSKSHLQRLLICAALSGKKCEIECGALSDDIRVMISALNLICADISYNGKTVTVSPKMLPEKNITVSCGESGAALRFLMPVCAALGKNVCFKLGNSLKKRPVKPLCDELSRHGVSVEEKDGEIIICGSLKSGDYSVSGEISSQFVSGLLFALPLLSGDSRLTVLGKLNSAPYTELTKNALRASNIEFSENNNVYIIKGNQKYSPPEHLKAEGDFSSAAAFLCMGALSKSGVTVTGLSLKSSQADRKITEILKNMGAYVFESEEKITVKEGSFGEITVDASDTPDLIPVIAALSAAASVDLKVINAERLRVKESDRLSSVSALINSLGGKANEHKDSLSVSGKNALSGGGADSFFDHRIAMAAAVASCGCKAPVTVKNAECVKKSYDNFWKDFDLLEVDKD